MTIIIDTTEWIVGSSVFHCSCFLLITTLFGVNFRRHRSAYKANKLSGSLFNLTYISMAFFAFVPLLILIRSVFIAMSSLSLSSNNSGSSNYNRDGTFVIETATNVLTYMSMLFYSLGQFVTYLIAVKRLRIILHGTCYEFSPKVYFCIKILLGFSLFVLVTDLIIFILKDNLSFDIMDNLDVDIILLHEILNGIYFFLNVFIWSLVTILFVTRVYQISAMMHAANSTSLSLTFARAYTRSQGGEEFEDAEEEAEDINDIYNDKNDGEDLEEEKTRARGNSTTGLIMTGRENKLNNNCKHLCDREISMSGTVTITVTETGTATYTTVTDIPRQLQTRKGSSSAVVCKLEAPSRAIAIPLATACRQSAFSRAVKIATSFSAVSGGSTRTIATQNKTTAIAVGSNSNSNGNDVGNDTHVFTSISNINLNDDNHCNWNIANKIMQIESGSQAQLYFQTQSPPIEMLTKSMVTPDFGVTGNLNINGNGNDDKSSNININLTVPSIFSDSVSVSQSKSQTESRPEPTTSSLCCLKQTESAPVCNVSSRLSVSCERCGDGEDIEDEIGTHDSYNCKMNWKHRRNSTGGIKIASKIACLDFSECREENNYNNYNNYKNSSSERSSPNSCNSQSNSNCNCASNCNSRTYSSNSLTVGYGIGEYGHGKRMMIPPFTPNTCTPHTPYLSDVTEEQEFEATDLDCDINTTPNHKQQQKQTNKDEIAAVVVVNHHENQKTKKDNCNDSNSGHKIIIATKSSLHTEDVDLKSLAPKMSQDKRHIIDEPPCPPRRTTASTWNSTSIATSVATCDSPNEDANGHDDDNINTNQSQLQRKINASKVASSKLTIDVPEEKEIGSTFTTSYNYNEEEKVGEKLNELEIQPQRTCYHDEVHIPHIPHILRQKESIMLNSSNAISVSPPLIATCRISPPISTSPPISPAVSPPLRLSHIQEYNIPSSTTTPNTSNYNVNLANGRGKNLRFNINKNNGKNINGGCSDDSQSQRQSQSRERSCSYSHRRSIFRFKKNRKGPYSDDITILMSVIIRGTVLCIFMVLCSANEFLINIIFENEIELSILSMSLCCLINSLCVSLFFRQNKAIYQYLCSCCHDSITAIMTKLVG